MTEPTLEEVRTARGLRLHFSKPGSPVTLCGHAVAQRRVGGSWRPEAPAGTDKAGFCLRCRNQAEGWKAP